MSNRSSFGAGREAEAMLRKLDFDLTRGGVRLRKHSTVQRDQNVIDDFYPPGQPELEVCSLALDPGRWVLHAQGSVALAGAFLTPSAYPAVATLRVSWNSNEGDEDQDVTEFAAADLSSFRTVASCITVVSAVKSTLPTTATLWTGLVYPESVSTRRLYGFSLLAFPA